MHPQIENMIPPRSLWVKYSDKSIWQIDYFTKSKKGENFVHCHKVCSQLGFQPKKSTRSQVSVREWNKTIFLPFPSEERTQQFVRIKKEDMPELQGVWKRFKKYDHDRI